MAGRSFGLGRRPRVAGVAVDLPRGDRYPAIVVRYTTLFRGAGPGRRWTRPGRTWGCPSWNVAGSFGCRPAGRSNHRQADADGDWITRLFGPLVRTPQHRRFDPLSARQWASPESWTDPPGDSAAGRLGELALRCLAEEYLAVGHAAEDASSLTWGGLLSGTQRRLEELSLERPPALLVDATALACAGIGGRTPVDRAARLVPSTVPGRVRSPGVDAIGGRAAGGATVGLGGRRRPAVPDRGPDGRPARGPAPGHSSGEPVPNA